MEEICEIRVDVKDLDENVIEKLKDYLESQALGWTDTRGEDDENFCCGKPMKDFSHLCSKDTECFFICENCGATFEVRREQLFEDALEQYLENE